ncbi:MAG: Six-cysteine peptide [Pelosinus sp.]|nr:Six-cysteine peptide [Pelosinus sp.]
MAKHIITVNKASLQETVHTGGCGECQTWQSGLPEVDPKDSPLS